MDHLTHLRTTVLVFVNEVHETVSEDDKVKLKRSEKLEKHQDHPKEQKKNCGVLVTVSKSTANRYRKLMKNKS